MHEINEHITHVSVADYSCHWIDAPFSFGHFKSLAAKAVSKKKNKNEKVKASEIEEDVDSEVEAEVYSCPQEGCVKVFQRLSNLERHLSFEKCEKVVERVSMLDLAKTKYASLLEEGVGVVPVLTSTVPLMDANSTRSAAQEGWALKQSNKSYRFNEKQKLYLKAKFNIGQSTGRKVNAEAVAKEMRRSIGPDGKRLFGVSEFLTPQQIKSFFSREAAKLSQKAVTEADVSAFVEEANFRDAREAILSTFQLEHPIVHDQYNICDMAQDGVLKKLKLPLLKELCNEFQLEEPSDKRKKAPYIALLEEMVSCCSCSTR